MKRKHVCQIVLALGMACAVSLAFAACTDPQPPVTYAVTYVKGAANATGNAPAGGEYEAGATVTVAGNTFTYEGYTFTGWNDGTRDYAAGATFEMPAHAVTLTAQWEANAPQTYAVTFAKGADEATGTAPTMAAKESGAAVTLPANSFTYEGHTFTGWKASTDNQVYQPEATYTMTAAAVTFTAQWEANAPQTYAVTFAKGADGATGDAPTMEAKESGAAVTLPANPFTRPHYTFAGWQASTDNQVYQPQATYTMTEAAVTFTAQWTANPVTISFVGGEGATGAMENATGTFGSTYTVPTECGFTREGYRFIGWEFLPPNSVDNEREVISNGRVSLNARTLGTGDALVLYARWEQRSTAEYTITFVQSTREDQIENITGELPTLPNALEGDTVTLPQNPFVFAHYRFNGWRVQSYNTQEDYWENVVDRAEAGATFEMPAVNVRICAVWVPNSVTVSFDANGGSGEKAPYTGSNYGTPLSMNNSNLQNTFTAPQGKEFAGWSTAPGGEIIESSLSLREPAVGADDTITLYAIWVDPPVDIATFAGTWTNAGGDEVIITGSGESGTMIYKGQAVIPVISMSGAILAATEDYSYYIVITVGEGTLSLLDAMTETTTVFTNKAATVNAEASAFAGKWSGANRYWYFSGDKAYYRTNSESGSAQHVNFEIIGDYALFNITATNSFLPKKGETMTGYNLYDAERGPIAVTFSAAADTFYVLTVNGEIAQLVAANSAPAAITVPQAPTGQKFDHWVLAGTETVFDPEADMTADASITAVFVDEGSEAGGAVTYTGNCEVSIDAFNKRTITMIVFDAEKLQITYTYVDSSSQSGVSTQTVDIEDNSNSIYKPDGTTGYYSLYFGNKDHYIAISADGNTLIICDSNDTPLTNGTFTKNAS